MHSSLVKSSSSQSPKSEKKVDQVQSATNTKDGNKLDQLSDLSQKNTAATQLKQIEQLGSSSAGQKGVSQLQSLADGNHDEVIQPMFGAARTAIKRAAPSAGRAIAYGSGAASVFGAASQINGTLSNDSLSPKEKVFDVSREALVTGLGFASGPFGKLGTAMSIASNLYDANQARMKAQGAGESPLNADTIEAFAKAEVDKLRAVADFGTFGKVLDFGMGVEKIINNKSALQDRFSEIHRIIAESTVSEFDPMDGF